MPDDTKADKPMFLHLPMGPDAYLRGLAAASGLPLVRIVAALAQHAQAAGWTVEAAAVTEQEQDNGQIAE
jgi:hypothetical protein